MTAAVEVQTKTAELRFLGAKETDNTIQFKEVVGPGKAKVSGTLYLQKSFTQDIGLDPETMEVEVLVTLKRRS